MIDPNCRCPVCGKNTEDFTPTREGAVPKVDDVAICAYCASVLVYDGNPLRLRLPMGHERAELYGDAQIAQARQVVRAAAASRQRSAL